MIRIDRPGSAGIRHHRQLRELNFGERHVRADQGKQCGAQRIVGKRRSGRRRRRKVAAQDLGALREAAAIGRSRARHDAPVAPVENVAGAVHDDKRSDHDAAKTNRRGADAALHAGHTAGHEHLAHRGAGTCADASFSDRAAGGRLTRAIGLVGTDANPAIADRQIVDDGSDDDRHTDVRYAPVIPDALLLEETNDSGGRAQSHGSAACQQEAMNVIERTDGLQHHAERFPRRRAVVVRSGGRRLVEQDGGTSGRPAAVGEMPHAHATDVGEGAGRRICRRLTCRRGDGRRGRKNGRSTGVQKLPSGNAHTPPYSYCSPPRIDVMRWVLKPSQCIRPT